MNDAIHVRRDKLFEEVWATPMSKLSKRYGISDVGLARICRRMNVPVPPRGYWARIAHGQKITKPALPSLKSGTPEQIEIHPISEEEKRERKLQSVIVEPPVDPADRIIVNDSLIKPHPLIQAARQHLKSSHPDTYGRLTTHHGSVDIRVGRDSVPRALRIMDALVKAFIKHGYTIKPESDYGPATCVVVDGHSISFALDVASKRFNTPEAELKKDRWAPKWRHVPTEILRLRLQGGIQLSDRVGHPIETQLDTIPRTLVQIGRSIQEREEAWKKQQAIHAEQERIRYEAQVRQKKLFEDVSNWSKSEQLRGFVARLKLELEKDPAKTTDYATDWLRWADEYIHHYDPFSEGLEKFFQYYQVTGWGSSISRQR